LNLIFQNFVGAPMSDRLKNDQTIYAALDRFLPAGTSAYFPELLDGHSVLIKVTRSRTSKFGDYRPLRNKKYLHQITINNDLNPYAFLVTFLHEIAHMYVYEIHKNKVKPHGPEWKDIYATILAPFISKDFLPVDVHDSLLQHINGPTASSCSDHKLFQALKKYNPESNGLILLEALPLGSHFKWRNGMIFQKAAKVRKRFRCIEIISKRVWFFHPMAEIEQIEI
jgi:SprT protein